MTYDALAESVSLIETRSLPTVLTLSRRRRHAAMSVDVADGLAVTTFARRGVNRTWYDIHVLALLDGRWGDLGGSSSSGGGDDDLLAPRPDTFPAEVAAILGGDGALPGAGSMIESGYGGVSVPHDRSGDEWISYGVVQVTTAVAGVQIAERAVAVPWHGRIVLVWAGRKPQTVVGVDALGSAVAQVVLRPG